jgi:transcriptional regulator with XRE-family HTH domain
MALGKNIRKLRRDRKWDLPTLAEKAGVDVGTISALEVRDSKRSQYLPNFAKAFGVTMKELLDGEAGPPSAQEPPPPYAELSPQAIEVARAWMKLPQYKQRGYAQAIMVDAAVVEVFPELERTMRMVAVATDPSYHKATERFRLAREELKRQFDLNLEGGE